MPRTKQTRQKTKVKNNNFEELTLQELNSLEDQLKIRFDSELIKIKTVVETLLQQTTFNFSEKEMNKTVYELRTGNMTDISKITDLSSLRNITASSTKTSRHRSLSCGDDEGYLTAGSKDGGRKSRSRIPNKNTAKKNIRPSRSVSKSKQHTTALNSFITPANKGKPQQTIGSITPKMKPNTPQVLLRRPKQGEMAISLQGSPLMVSSVSSDAMANVNIPLTDGRILTIQPQRGLRESQIPTFSPGTRRQIETLRDNLNKVCAINYNI